MTTNPSLSTASSCKKASCQQCRDAHHKCEFKSDQAKCTRCLAKDLACDKVVAPGQRRKVQQEMQEKMREENGIMTSVLRFPKNEPHKCEQSPLTLDMSTFEELPDDLRDIGEPHELMFTWTVLTK